MLMFPNLYICFFCYGYGDHRDLHVLTHSVPTRRSSDLRPGQLDRQRLAVTVAGLARRHANPAFGDAIFLDIVADAVLEADADAPLEHEIGRAHVELQSLMRNSYAVFCLKKKKIQKSTG